MTTKEKIKQAATKAFNEKGFAAVNLKELAKIMGISRGNLAYHFKDKDILLEAIAKEMWEKIESAKQKTKQRPSFVTMQQETQLYFKFQKEYSFIFLDTHVTNHPKIKEQFRAMIAQSIKGFMNTIAFGIQVGNVKQELIPGTYNSLAFTVWMVGFYWLPQQITRGEKTKTNAEKIIWSLILPYMTNKGIASFKQFYGESFYAQLGEPFTVDIHSLLTF